MGAPYTEGVVRPATNSKGKVALEGRTDHAGVWKVDFCQVIMCTNLVYFVYLKEIRRKNMTIQS